MTSASPAEGRQLDPGQVYFLVLSGAVQATLLVPTEACAPRPPCLTAPLPVEAEGKLWRGVSRFGRGKVDGMNLETGKGEAG